MTNETPKTSKARLLNILLALIFVGIFAVLAFYKSHPRHGASSEETSSPAEESQAPADTSDNGSDHKKKHHKKKHHKGGHKDQQSQGAPGGPVYQSPSATPITSPDDVSPIKSDGKGKDAKEDDDDDKDDKDDKGN